MVHLSLCFLTPSSCFFFLDIVFWFSFMSSRWYFTPHVFHPLLQETRFLSAQNAWIVLTHFHEGPKLAHFVGVHGPEAVGGSRCGWGCDLIPGASTLSVGVLKCMFVCVYLYMSFFSLSLPSLWGLISDFAQEAPEVFSQQKYVCRIIFPQECLRVLFLSHLCFCAGWLSQFWVNI